MEGTKTLVIQVAHKDVLDRVKSSSYYSGEAAKGSLQEVAALLQASADDDDVLVDDIKEASTKAVNTLQRYLGRTELGSYNVEEATTPVFSSTDTYSQGDKVKYQLPGEPYKRYKAKQNISPAETWTPSHWDEIAWSKGVQFTVAAPINYTAEDATPDAVVDAVADYLTDFVLREWMKPIPATSQYFDNKLKDDTQTLRELCSFRKKPVR